jgi:hypothetical protein
VSDPIELDALLNPDALLLAWLEFWRTCDDMPAKMPDSLHTRTAVYLTTRGLLTTYPEQGMNRAAAVPTPAAARRTRGDRP